MVSKENPNSASAAGGSAPASGNGPATQAPSTSALQLPFVMHLKRGTIALVVFILGPIGVLVGFKIGSGLVGGSEVSALSPFGIFLVVVVVLVLAAMLLSTDQRFVIEPNEVRIIGPFGKTTKRHPIQGVGDLVIDGKKLRRRSDRKSLAVFSSLDCRASDIATLTAAIPSA